MCAFIFDMDGLMLDTQPLAHQALKRAAEDFDFNLSQEICNQVRGLSEDNTLKYFEDVLRIKIPNEEYFARFNSYYKELLNNGIAIKPGLFRLLDILESYKMPKAVATSTNYELALRKLEQTNLSERFSIIVGGDQVKRGKPFPDIFLLAAEKLFVDPKACYVLEDSDTGIKAANDARMMPIMVPDGNVPNNESLNFALKIYSSLQEVCDSIGELI